VVTPSGLGRKRLDSSGSGSLNRSGLQRWQSQDQLEVVIGCDTVVALEAACQAAVNDHVLAVAAQKRADGRHRSTAAACTVTRHAAVNVLRVEAERAVVAVLASIGNRHNHCLAMAASEVLLLPGGSWPNRAFVVFVAGATVGSRQGVVLHEFARMRRERGGMLSMGFALWFVAHTRASFFNMKSFLSLIGYSPDRRRLRLT
jgi:hypothetical protein